MPSLARNSLARFSADALGLVLSVATSIITARWLGPAGKGLLSAIAFLSSVVLQICFVGLGESAIVRIGQKKNSMQTALSASMAALVPASLIAMAVLWGTSRFEFRADWSEAQVAVLIACISLPASMVSLLAANILNSQELFVSTSSILVAASTFTTAATWFLVVELKKGIEGAIAATLIGISVGAVLAGALLLRQRLTFRPRFDRDYLKFALSYGPKLQLSQLMVLAAARLDLLIVYSLAGQAAAGQYSIALTASSIGGMLPISLIIASFPRLANVSEEESVALAARISRATVALSLVSCAGLAILVPFGLPLAFGKAYAPAIATTLILLIAPLVGSAQYHICRAWAARGDPSLLFKSYGITTCTMLALDFLLIPAYGIRGAAIASVSGNMVGTAVCLNAWRVKGRRARALVPAMEDFREIVRLVLKRFAPDSEVTAAGG